MSPKHRFPIYSGVDSCIILLLIAVLIYTHNMYKDSFSSHLHQHFSFIFFLISYHLTRPCAVELSLLDTIELAIPEHYYHSKNFENIYCFLQYTFWIIFFLFSFTNPNCTLALVFFLMMLHNSHGLLHSYLIVFHSDSVTR